MSSAFVSPTSGCKNKPSHDFERGLLHVLVRAVNRVARLKRDDALPAARREHLARVERRVAKFWKLQVVRQVNDRYFAREVHVALLVEPRDAGMFFVRRAIDVLRLACLVVFEFLRERHHREQMPIRFRQRDLFADGQRVRDFARDRKRDRNAPHQTIRQSHRFDDRIVIALAHKAGQRRERADREQFEIGHILSC